MARAGCPGSRPACSTLEAIVGRSFEVGDLPLVCQIFAFDSRHLVGTLELGNQVHWGIGKKDPEIRR